MTNTSVIFSFEGRDINMQCSKDDKMKDICQKFANKIKRNFNSLYFLYGGNQLNFQLSFKEQANLIDKERNKMKVLVYKNDSDELSCPKCGGKINFNNEIINDIKSSIYNINDIVKGAKLIIENIIKISAMENVNVQLKNVNLIFNNLNEDIKKLDKKFDDLFNATNINKEKTFENYIIAKIEIKDEDVNKNIKIISSFEEDIRINPGKWIVEDIFNNEEEIKKCEIKINGEIIPFNYNHKFKSKGKYTIKYTFKNNLKSMCSLFGGCKLLNIIDLSNFNVNNVIDMSGLFDGCSLLNNINLSNINTNNVIYMNRMFYGCSSLTKIDLSNINTNNVTHMDNMFYECTSLTKIDLSHFNTNNVTDMCCMLYGCSSLNEIDLSHFNTNNVTNMCCMFFGCSSLKNINLSNFNINKVANMNGMFYGCSSLTKIDIYNFNINKVTDINYMFGECPSLNKNNIIIKDKNIFKNKTLFQKGIVIKISK